MQYWKHQNKSLEINCINNNYYIHFFLQIKNMFINKFEMNDK